MLEKEMQKYHALTNYGVFNENKVKVKAQGSSMNANAKHSTKRN
jgi:hypothetical protein